MITLRVRPQGQPPPLGTKLRVQLEQNVSGKPIHFVGFATAYGDRAVLRLTQSSEAGRVAVELLQEELVDPWYWGSKKPTLRLRP